MDPPWADRTLDSIGHLPFRIQTGDHRAAFSRAIPNRARSLMAGHVRVSDTLAADLAGGGDQPLRPRHQSATVVGGIEANAWTYGVRLFQWPPRRFPAGFAKVVAAMGPLATLLGPDLPQLKRAEQRWAR